MTDEHKKIEERLKRLALATGELRPRAGFTDRVVLAAEAAVRPGWLESVTMSARAGFVVALLATTAALAVAVQSEQAATEASAVAYGAVGVEW